MPEPENSNHGLILFNPYIGPLSGTTTPGQCGPGSDDKEEVFHIPQSFSISGTSPSDCLVSYPEHLLGGLTPPQRCIQCILQPQLTGKRCRGGYNSFPWIATLYPWYVLYNAKCSAIPFFEFLVWYNLGLNPGLPGHWQTLYPLG